MMNLELAGGTAEADAVHEVYLRESGKRKMKNFFFVLFPFYIMCNYAYDTFVIRNGSVKQITKVKVYIFTCT